MPSALSVSDWKKLLKEHTDAADTSDVTKALEKLAKAEPKGKDAPEPLLEALNEVLETAKDAKVANARDKKRKDLVAVLEDMLKEAATQKVKVERLLQEKKERDAEGEDVDEDSGNEQALLTERLIKVKRLDKDRAKPFVLALGRKAHGLVIAKTNVLSTDHKKRARKMRDGNGKLLIGKVYGEKGKHVFELEIKPPSGMAKALKKTALKQTDLPPLRVLVRGPDGHELDDENDLEEMADLGVDDENEEAGTTAPGSTDSKPTSLQDQFTAQAKQLKAELDRFNKAEPKAAGPLLKAYAAALQLAKGGKFAEGIAALDKVEADLKDAESSVTAENPAELAKHATSAWTPEVEKHFLAKWTTAKAAWQKASDDVDAQISQLQTAMRTSGFREIREVAEYGLNGATGNFKVPLLASFRNIESSTGVNRLKEALKARKVIEGFKNHIAHSELVEVVDDNPFEVPVTIRATIGPALDSFTEALGVVTATVGK